ncbi:hypothetical protein [Candidatus Enterovibrio escicola]|uniref:hypothetical protein n=1 Tax=Candidatus Enterovibrio escicola TaxID=1927127 RepID=UPI001680BB23|nr:hypothetical protein [Candidatus Enterovibrio escacola]
MEGRIYNINKHINHGKQKIFVPSPDDSIKVEMTKRSLLVCNIRPFLNTNAVLYLYLIDVAHLDFVEFSIMGKILV